MRRLARHLFTLCSAVSLLLCAAVCVLWARSYRQPQQASDRWGMFVTSRAVRYTFESRQGAVTLFAPPVPPPPAPPIPPPPPPKAWSIFGNDPMEQMRLMPLAPDASPERLVSDIRNDQIVWDVCRKAREFSRPVQSGLHAFFSPRGGPGTAAQVLAPGDPLDEFQETFDRPNPARHIPFPANTGVTPALLAALEDPQRWVAAHVLLTEVHGDGRAIKLVGGKPVGPWPPGRFGWPLSEPWGHAYNGLRAELRPSGPEYEWTDDASDGDYYAVTPCAAEVDPAQMGVIRDGWHRRLDRPLASVRWWYVFAATCALPTAWGMIFTFRNGLHRSRRCRGLCPKCGYDLRASPGRCPECGAGKSARISN